MTISEYQRRKAQLTQYRRILMLASLGTLGSAIAPAPANAVDFFDSPGARACMAVVASQDPAAIEDFLKSNPDDPMVPAMLSAIRPSVLAGVSRSAVADLPQTQIERLTKQILLMFGLIEEEPEPVVAAPAPTPPKATPKPRQTPPKTSSQY